MPNCFTQNEKKVLQYKHVVNFWVEHVFKNQTPGTEETLFPTLKRLVSLVFSLPHSNAEPERQFSDVKNRKTGKSNQLIVPQLSSTCVVKSYSRAYNVDEFNFKASPEHFD